MSQKGMLTRREVAELPDLPGQRGPVHPQTVVKWELNGMPVAHRGRKGKPSLYREADVRAWLSAREEAKAGDQGIQDLAVERARKEHFQALLAEQTHRARARDLLPRHEVEKVWAAERDAIRGKLLALPVACADAVHRAGTLGGVSGVEAALKTAVYDVLRELAGGPGTEGPKSRARKAKAK